MTMMAEPERPGELPERWSAKTKSDVVLRLSAAGLSRTSQHHATSHHQQQWGKPQATPPHPPTLNSKGLGVSLILAERAAQEQRELFVAQSCGLPGIRAPANDTDDTRHQRLGVKSQPLARKLGFGRPNPTGPRRLALDLKPIGVGMAITTDGLAGC